MMLVVTLYMLHSWGRGGVGGGFHYNPLPQFHFKSCGLLRDHTVIAASYTVNATGKIRCLKS